MNTDRPIIFSGPMVRAILDGRKTQTRRVLKPQPEAYENKYCTRLRFNYRHGRMRGDASPDLLSDGTCPAASLTGFCIADRLWVRESWAHDAPDAATCRSRYEDALPGGVLYGPYYRATEPMPEILNWHPSIFMPRWASRLTLIVEDVQVQRLQEISEEDAEAEGVFRHVAEHSLNKVFRDERGPTALKYFRELWDSINAKRGYGWETDPWVVAVTFRTIKQNIDAIEKDAA